MEERRGGESPGRRRTCMRGWLLTAHGVDVDRIGKVSAMGLRARSEEAEPLLACVRAASEETFPFGSLPRATMDL